ncbi:Eco57I restriction-modification methylase [Nocardioides alpinus]|uniref:site-specific DNA-methyltransferase (adenine-specific) n=1 Tax=Nocardioides alpinus TaxID=748909 RepID=A0A1I1AR60_9ACTN|nr:Eco57I restriction-modification methylase domain-containing protein [Nocardioides alpinus]PKH41709.1 hypothetical protein CXG46_07455 [Nocardioides alpinus]SFB38833.1 Eco57I restriction-modification methylase [Nocardioides alpinus]
MTEQLSESRRHLASLGRDHRRDLGVVYTPDDLVEFVLTQEFGSATGPAGPVLDPACGTGAFLKAVVVRIADDLACRGLAIESTGRRRFLEEIARLVWGVDVDEQAIGICRRELGELIERLAPGPMPADLLDKNIMRADFLDVHPEPISGVPFRHIVGNPPYVATDRMDAEAKKEYRGRFQSAIGRFDLYYLFMERASEVVHEGGTWTLITPDKYLNSNSGQGVRTLLARNGAIRVISRFSSHSVFRDAATVPCVTTWSRSRSVTADASVRQVDVCEGSGGVELREEVHVPTDSFHAGVWIFHSRSSEALLDTIRADHPPLNMHVQRISAGLTTGFNPAFIVSYETAQEIEPELLHPTIRGRDLAAYEIGQSASMMLVPYVWDAHGSAKLIDLNDFPLAARWLRRHRSRLESRHAVRKWGKAWWDLHDPVGIPLHCTPKLLVPDVARSNRFAFDSGNFVPQHSTYYLLPKDINGHFLTAVLNSPPIELLVRSSAPRVKDGFSRYRKQFLLDLPLPAADPDMAERIIAAAVAGDNAEATRLATALFKVDDKDVTNALERLNHSRRDRSIVSPRAR